MALLETQSHHRGGGEQRRAPPGEIEHWFDDTIAGGSETRLDHDCTIGVDM